MACTRSSGAQASSWQSRRAWNEAQGVRCPVCCPAVCCLCTTMCTQLPCCPLCRKKTVRKEYRALAVGVPPQRDFTVDAPIDRDEEEQ